MMPNIMLVVKHICMVGILICIILTPAYLACANDRKKDDLARIRGGSWLFGWTFVGWVFALFLSAKK